ncbi:DUF5301 domain-containing protein [Paenibacillus sp. SAF-054]|uniref:DUF5301 domain-containing protein n=1 Tax=unclassified Paenibacillus TaxID=185978 RepID=UPI003F7E48CB
MAAVMIIAMVGLVTFHSYSKNTTFKGLVLTKINTDQISSVEVLKSSTDEKKTLTDKSEINQIINSLSVITLRAGSYTAIDTAEPYYMTIRINNQRRFGLLLYDEDVLKVYDYQSNGKKNATT